MIFISYEGLRVPQGIILHFLVLLLNQKCIETNTKFHLLLLLFTNILYWHIPLALQWDWNWIVQSSVICINSFFPFRLVSSRSFPSNVTSNHVSTRPSSIKQSRLSTYCWHFGGSWDGESERDIWLSEPTMNLRFKFHVNLVHSFGYIHIFRVYILYVDRFW